MDQPKFESLAPGIKYNLSKEKLVLDIDLSRSGEISKSGKSTVRASTRGNVKIPGSSMVLGVNLYEPH